MNNIAQHLKQHLKGPFFERGRFNEGCNTLQCCGPDAVFQVAVIMLTRTLQCTLQNIAQHLKGPFFEHGHFNEGCNTLQCCGPDAAFVYEGFFDLTFLHRCPSIQGTTAHDVSCKKKKTEKRKHKLQMS